MALPESPFIAMTMAGKCMGTTSMNYLSYLATAIVKAYAI
jgi:hypothetical protein